MAIIKSVEIKILWNSEVVKAFAAILVPLPYLAQLTDSQTANMSTDWRNVLVQNFLEIL